MLDMNGQIDVNVMELLFRDDQGRELMEEGKMLQAAEVAERRALELFFRGGADLEHLGVADDFGLHCIFFDPRLNIDAGRRSERDRETKGLAEVVVAHTEKIRSGNALPCVPRDRRRRSAQRVVVPDGRTNVYLKHYKKNRKKKRLRML